MKTTIATAAAVVLGHAAGWAHQKHDHASGPGVFGQPPEYVHVLLNPLPVYGLAIGLLALGVALVSRSNLARAIALSIIVMSSASAWPVSYYGHNAYAQVREKADESGKYWLDEHMERGEKLVYVLYATALLGIAALVSHKKFPAAATPLALATLIASVASLGAGGWISKAGGQIRHPEFRGESAPSVNAAPYEHGASEQSPEKMPQPQPGADHKHGETSESSAEKIPMPETLEGNLKAIRAYYAEFESAVNAKKFGEVKSGAKTIGAPTKKLVEVAPADRRPVVESGVSKINQALDELKSSAETGSDSVMKMRFKEFEQALEQLEQQMKTNN